MPRSQSAHAATVRVEGVREVRRPRRTKRDARRLRKRVVHKTDGRYLIYYEKI